MSSKKIYRQIKSNYRTYLPIPENEGYTVIGSGACYNMRGFMITIPEGVEIIEPYAFAGCNEIAHVELPSTLKVIGEGAFLDCVMLREINVPEGVQMIGDLAFFNCGKNLRGKTFKLTVPDSVKAIGQNVYPDLAKLGDPIPRPSFTAKIRYCRNGEDEIFTLSEIDPYAAKEAIVQVRSRPFVLLAIHADAAVIYSYNDEISLVLPLGETVHAETTHIVGAAYEYTDTTTTYHYVSDFTLTELTFN